jgi:hypothetical protein
MVDGTSFTPSFKPSFLSILLKEVGQAGFESNWVQTTNTEKEEIR